MFYSVVRKCCIYVASGISQNGNVNLGNFDKKIKDGYKEKGGWIIEKDYAEHGGSRWKLKRPNRDRVASLDKNGKVLRK